MLEAIRFGLVRSILNPLLVRYHGSRELELLRLLLRSERYQPEQLELLRFERLRAMLKHAAFYVPFYRRRFTAAGFDPDKMSGFADLKKLPLLTKEDIQVHGEELISSYYERKQLVENRTGGSTGSPLVFYHNRERIDSRQAATLRHNLWAGYAVGRKVAMIWGHQLDLSLYTSLKARIRNWLIDRQLIIDAASLSEEKLHDFARRYRSFRPDIVLAYANSVAAVVEFCEANRIELPSPRAIITTAEVLSEEYRKRIEGYFKARIFDRYGCREVSVIATECEAHQGMHINAEHLYVEFLSDNQDVAPGEQGEIVITDLGNYAFPFIRYQVGDLGSPASGDCPCGRTLPRMQMIAGRTSDFLRTTDGRRVSGTALTILLAAEIPGVRQAQIVQREPGRLIFNLATDADFTEASQQLLQRKVAHFFGDDMSFTVNRVDRIPREASGKYRFSICELKE